VYVGIEIFFTTPLCGGKIFDTIAASLSIEEDSGVMSGPVVNGLNMVNVDSAVQNDNKLTKPKKENKK
jgi:hypothetical protein